MDSAFAACAGRSKISTVIVSLPRRRREPFFATLPSACTRPDSISSWTRVRLSSGHCVARKRSRRVPASAEEAISSRQTEVGGEGTADYMHRCRPRGWRYTKSEEAKRDSSTAQTDAFAGANAEEKVGLLRSE